VVAGGVEDLDWLEAEAPHLGVRRVVRLKVAGAFHSPFMATAGQVVEDALSRISIHSPAFPVWANVTGRPFDPDRIGELLIDQVVEPVRFGQILEGMGEAGIDLFLHLGPGDVTAGLARRAVPGARTLSVSEVGAIGTAAASLGSIG